MKELSVIPSAIICCDSLQNLFLQLTKDCTEYSQCILITDEHLKRLYPTDLQTIIVPEGEKAKTFEIALQVWQELIAKGFDRHSVLIALGGGAICDITGFIASCYMRGIASFYIPTTLLAMVDASIGGKTGVNMGGHKNRIGTFHQSQKILICSDFLQTLPEREVASGMAEIIKMGVVCDPELFENLEKGVPISELIDRCARAKAEIVEQDPYDEGIRSILNWGHTVGHALEGLTGYARWLHGEAVAIGMSCEAFISWKLGYAEESFYERQNRLIQKYKLPTILPDDIDIDALLLRMEQDKKAVHGKIRLILARQNGTVLSVPDLDKDILKEALEAKRSSDH